MLKIDLAESDIHRDGPWRELNGRWVRGSSYVEPFGNVALETVMLQVRDAALIVVRERLRGQPPLPTSCTDRPTDDSTAHTAETILAQTRSWAADFIIVHVGPEVVIEAGAGGVAPLYLSEDGQRLIGSWDMTDLRERFRTDDLNLREMVARMTGQTRYSAQTLFRGVHRLTERARAHWRPGTPLHIELPEPAVHYLPREMRDCAPVVEAYDSLLTAAVSQRALRASDVVVEISGGTDSATAALAAGACLTDGPLASYGLLIGGDAGPQQIMRRSWLTASAGTIDHTVDAAATPPLTATPGLSTPDDEPYRAAVQAALDRTDRTVVFTGIGGDELVALRPEEQQLPPARAVPIPPSYLSGSAQDLARGLCSARPELPVSAIPECTLSAFLVRAPTFLRAGRWPVAPLCNSDLMRFGEWLPAQWRSGKRLPREWLSARGLPDEVVWPQMRENFAGVMQKGLRTHGITGLSELVEHGGRLIDLGLVSQRGVADLLAAACTARASGAKIDGSIYELLEMERALRTLLA
jgi:asparagine synthase (glutamine-hydrolysing)